MLPLPTDRPFTLEHAQRCGHSRRVVQGRRFQIIFPRVHAATALEITPRVLVQAALLAAPAGCAASHHSGLLLYASRWGSS